MATMDALASTWDRLVRRATGDADNESNYPAAVKHGGKTWSKTGKLGSHIASGEASAEYVHHTNYGKPGNKESRNWRTASGKMTGDDGPRSITASTGKTYTSQPKTPLHQMRTGSPAWRQEVSSQNTAKRVSQTSKISSALRGKDSAATHRSAWQQARQKVSDAVSASNVAMFGVAAPSNTQSQAHENAGLGRPAGSGPFGAPPQKTSSDESTVRSVPKKPSGKKHFGGTIISGDASRKVFFKGSVRDAMKRGMSACDALSHALRSTNDAWHKMKLPPHPKARRARIATR